MSEHSSNGSRALLPGQVKSWLGVVAFVLVAVAVLAFAFVLIRPTTNTDRDRRTAQKALRADTESKAKALLTAPAKNPDGTYRLPVADAMAVIAANPKVLADLRKSAAAPAPSSASATFVKAEDEQMKRGLAVYSRTCIACHQPTGKGLAPVFPSIAATPIVNGDATLPIKFILHGLMGPITVDGVTYNSMMPPVAGVSDQDIADVLTYVRQSFGNKSNPVTADQVKVVRAANANRTAPWNTAELGLK
ncbi:MAG: cytochrome c [Verrucomicrobiota bacterium]|jgi:nitrite reductase (NO-forming)